MVRTDKIPRIYTDDTLHVYSPNRHRTGGMTFIFHHLPTREVLVVDFGIGFSAIQRGGTGADDPVQDYLNLITSLRGPSSEPLPVFLTHGHYDHFYGVPRLSEKYPIEVFATPFTLHLLANLQTRQVTQPAFTSTVLTDPTGSVQRGPFTVSYFPTVHALPQTRSFVIEMPRVDRTSLRVLMMAEFRVAEAGYTPGLSQVMLDQVAAHGPYDLILYDGLRHHQPGFSPPEDDIRPVLGKILDRIPGTLIVSFISSKIGLQAAFAEELRELGHLYDTRGGAMSRLYKLACKAGWTQSPPHKPHQHQKVVLAVTGSQNEPGSFLSRLAESATNGEILPNDFLWIVQGSIPMYISEIRAMYERLAALLPEGGIIIPRAEQRRLRLRGPNIYILEEFVRLEKPFELSSGHGKLGDQEHVLLVAQTRGPAGTIIPYQMEAKDMSEDAGEVVEVPEPEAPESDLLRATRELLESYLPFSNS